MFNDSAESLTDLASPFVGGNFDRRAIGVPVAGAIVKHDIPALYFQNVEGLKIRGLEVEWADPLPDFFTEAIYCEHFRDLIIDGFVGRQARRSAGAAVVLKDGSKVSVRNSEAAPDTGTFLSLDGVTDLRLLVDNDLSNAEVAISPPRSQFEMASGNNLSKTPNH